MIVACYIAAGVSVLATGVALTRANAVHALLALVVALLALALVFFLIGAPLAAAFQVIIYAGAIVVLFLFAVMLLGLDAEEIERERAWIPARIWIGPAALALAIAGALWCLALREALPAVPAALGHPAGVAAALLGPYLLSLELAGLLLLAGLVGAFHIGRRAREEGERREEPGR